MKKSNTNTTTNATKTVLFGTGNANKVREYQQILISLDPMFSNWIFKTKPECFVEPEENFSTLKENALFKMAEYKKQAIENQIEFDYILSEDFGFIVEGMEHLTSNGVKSKRILEGIEGYENTDEGRNQYLLDNCSGKKCKYISALAVGTKKDVLEVEGYTSGVVAQSSKGENGFAFDFIMQMPNKKTLAEYSAEEKNEVSSRRNAMEEFYKIIIK